jgi:divalent metal cation (Fe/Co/Zn/Cd) transporter
VKPVVLYTLVRLGLFAVLIAILVPLLAAWVPAWVSAVIAAVVAFCISYLAFGNLRRRVSEDLAAARASNKTSTITQPAVASDEEFEDRA